MAAHGQICTRILGTYIAAVSLILLAACTPQPGQPTVAAQPSATRVATAIMTPTLIGAAATVTPVPVASAVATGTVTQTTVGTVLVKLRQTTTIPAENLVIEFVRVVEDTRCPSDVQCFWSGEAIIELKISKDGADRGTIRLSTLPNETNRATAGGYTFKLEKLDPYPKLDSDKSKFEYAATLLVMK